MVLRPETLDPATAPCRSTAFGTQAYARIRNQPSYSFGTSTVEARANEYLGKEFCPLQLHMADSPGPAHYRSNTAPPTRGQVDLRWGATTTGRMFPELPSHSFRAPPGPGTYSVPVTLGRSIASASMPSIPSYSWTHCSTRERNATAYISQGHERELLGKCSPGPHVVGREAFDSMGLQANSLRRSNARFAPPKAERFVKLKSTDKSSWPGPGQYNC